MRFPSGNPNRRGCVGGSSVARGGVSITLPALLAAALASACIPGSDGEAPRDDHGDPAAAAEPLTAEELERGVGPVRSVTVDGAVDPALASRGEHTFRSRCVACHRMADRSVGPPLGDVATRRTPEFVMNMILNPIEMVARHPEARALKERYVTPMPDQGLSRDDARAVLEYLRREARTSSAASP